MVTLKSSTDFVQYNIAVLPTNGREIREMGSRVQQYLQGYRCFTDGSGNLQGTGFHRERIPYIGEAVIIRTIRKEAADTAQRVLSGVSDIEKWLVLPTNECSHEEDKERIQRAREIGVFS
jgi:hypothetical protein